MSKRAERTACKSTASTASASARGTIVHKELTVEEKALAAAVEEQCVADWTTALGIRTDLVSTVAVDTHDGVTAGVLHKRRLWAACIATEIFGDQHDPDIIQRTTTISLLVTGFDTVQDYLKTPPKSIPALEREIMAFEKEKLDVSRVARKVVKFRAQMDSEGVQSINALSLRKLAAYADEARWIPVLTRASLGYMRLCKDIAMRCSVDDEQLCACALFPLACLNYNAGSGMTPDALELRLDVDFWAPFVEPCRRPQVTPAGSPVRFTQMHSTRASQPSSTRNYVDCSLYRCSRFVPSPRMRVSWSRMLYRCILYCLVFP
jgi:hypothetical protein